MKKVLSWSFLSAIIMILIPYLLTVFLEGGTAMMVYFFILFYINPIYCVFLGIACGKKISKMYCLPLVCALMFVLGAWVFIDAYETVFLIYAGIYFALCLVSMIISAIFHVVKKKK